MNFKLYQLVVINAGNTIGAFLWTWAAFAGHWGYVGLAVLHIVGTYWGTQMALAVIHKERSKGRPE